MRHFKQYFFFLFQIVSRISAKWQPFWKSLYHHCWPTPQFRRLGQVAESDGDDFLRSRETHPLFHWCQHNKGSWNEVSQVSQTRFMLKGLKYGEALCRRVGSAVVVVVWVATATGHWIPWIKHWRKSRKNHMFQKFSRVLCRIAVYDPWRSKSWSGVPPRFWCSGTLRLHGCGVPIILTWPLRSIEGMSRPRRLSQVMADHCSIFMAVSFSHGFQFLFQRVCPSDMTAKWLFRSWKWSAKG